MRSLVTSFFVALCALIGNATAQTSRDYALMARAAWSAFECSSLASHMKDTKEQERLFLYGYKEGLAFIAALQAKKVQRADLSAEAPWIMLLLLQGPTPDFMLGRVYESAQETALKNVLKTGEQLNPDDLQKAVAQNEYTKRNCRLVGAAR